MKAKETQPQERFDVEITVRVTQKQKTRLEQESRKQKKYISALIRDIVSEKYPVPSKSKKKKEVNIEEKQ